MIKVAIAALAFSVFSANSSLAADWTVSKVSQPARYTVDNKTWVPLKSGMVIPNKSWVSTGPRARVVLDRAKDRVVFQPNTMAGVFEQKGFSIHTDFAQQTGTLELSIDPQKQPHLAVQTPYMAAVVKGTVFSVTVGRKGAKVGVSRGRVEVTDSQSGERVGVKAGQTVAVDNNPKSEMALSGTNTDFEPITHVKSAGKSGLFSSAPAKSATKANGNSTANGTSNGKSSGNGNSGGNGNGNSGGNGNGNSGGNGNGNSGGNGNGNSGGNGNGNSGGNGNGNSGGNGNGNSGGNGNGNSGGNGNGNKK